MSNFGQPPESPIPGGGYKAHRGVILIVLAVLGWAVCAICSFVAFFMARADRKEIAEGRMDPEGAGLTSAAYYIALVHIVLFVALFCIGASAAVIIPLVAPEPPPPSYDTNYPY